MQRCRSSVVLITPSLTSGGAERQISRLAVELQALGVPVLVYVLGASGPEYARLADAGVPTEFLSKDNRIPKLMDAVLVPFRLLRLLLREQPHTVHAWLLRAYSISMPIAWLARVPNRIQGRRGLNSGLRPGLGPRLAQRLVRPFTTEYTANAFAIVHDLVSTERVPRNRIHCIRNGVDLPDVQSNPSIEPPTGIVIASLIEYKGHMDLLAALSICKAEPQLQFIGEGPERHNIEAAISRYDLGRHITLRGQCPDPRPILLRAQFLILPSHTEGLPNAILEAMACGLPVIATNVGGVIELVEDQVTGLVVPAHDPVALAEAIDIMCSDHEFRTSAGKLARNRASHWAWEAVTSTYANLYTKS